MVDPVSAVKSFFSMAFAIKGTVETVKQNELDSQALAIYVETLIANLPSLDNNTAARRHPLVGPARDDLYQALYQAREVVAYYREKSTVYRHANADKLSKKLHRVKEDILAKMMRVVLFHTSILVNTTTTQHSQHEVQSLPQQEGHLVNSHEQEEAAPISSRSTKFDLSELKVATADFSEENVIGKSASCTVYKGKLSNGVEVAVKSYSKKQYSAFRKQCENEERFAAKLLHKNIMKLLGHCFSGEQYCQVYEYMHNQSLWAYMNGDRRGSEMPWQERFDILKGIARGLNYLHNNRGQCIIHLDLKPSNILLDHDFTPKISDFGISEMLPGSAEEGLVDSFMGTCGFKAPEYVNKRSFSVKSDVYSYGILLLELITGKICDQDDYIYILLVINLVWESWKQAKNYMDKSLFSDSVESHEEIERCIHIALLCIEEDPALRPTMSYVLQMLSGKELKLPRVQRPAYALI